MFDIIPPQLLIAQEELAAITTAVGRSIGLARQLSKARPSTLVHYTNSVGLEGIVSSNRLRATNIAYLNDASEFEHAVEQFRAAANDRMGNGDELVRSFCEELLKQASSPLPPVPFFVACFSEVENSLSQWRAYGGGEGGFSLCFDLSSLDTVAGAKVLDPKAPFLSPVVYERDVQARISNGLLDWAVNEFRQRAAAHQDDLPQFREDWTWHFLAMAAYIAPLFKNPDFRDEREWRLVHILRSRKDLVFSPRAKLLVPFVNLDLGAVAGRPKGLLPIVKVWSGPGSFARLSMIAARELLSKAEYEAVPLEVSSIPYRSVSGS